MRKVFARNDLQVINTTRTIALVVVPGVFGTRLKFTPLGLQPCYWDPNNPERLLSLQAYPMDERREKMGDNVDAEIMQHATADSSETARGWDSVADKAYRTFLEYLRDLKNLRDDSGKIVRVVVYVCGYDWRKSNAESAQTLANMLRSLILPKYDGVVLLTHSMGGLVTRYALLPDKQVRETRHQALLTDEERMKVLGVIHIAHPAAGGPAAYRRFFTGCRTEYGDVGTPFAGVQAKLFGETPEDWATLASFLQGGIELLPTKHFVDPDANHGWIKYKSGNEWKTCDPAAIGYDKLGDDHPPGVLPSGHLASWVKDYLWKRIKAAKKFHDTLDLYVHPHTFSIYGSGQDTDVKFSFDPNAHDDTFARGRDADGDGLVPSTSALAVHDETKDANRVFRVDLSGQDEFAHMNICEHEDVKSKVDLCIRALLLLKPQPVSPPDDPVPSDPAQGNGEWMLHIIKSGEYLSLIAANHGIDGGWKELYYYKPEGMPANWENIRAGPGQLPGKNGFETDYDLVYPDQVLWIRRGNKCPLCVEPP